MSYITYAEYQALSLVGTLTESSFDIWEKRAERKLDSFTQDRLKTATTIIDEVKELMAIFIDKMSNSALNGNITSYSNGIESFGFAENQNSALNKELKYLTLEYLPIELVSAYMEDVSGV